jgi:hypothetical protein
VSVPGIGDARRSNSSDPVVLAPAGDLSALACLDVNDERPVSSESGDSAGSIRAQAEPKYEVSRHGQLEAYAEDVPSFVPSGHRGARMRQCPYIRFTLVDDSTSGLGAFPNAMPTGDTGTVSLGS